jgi:hypothetical protein
VRILWSDLAKARQQQLIDSHALDGDPLLSRLWHHQLRWLNSFVKSAVTIQAKGIGFAARRRWCRIADRLFGGTREQEYCEKLNRRAEWHREQARQLKEQLQESAERSFNRDVLYQSLTNPHFVVTNRPHQDRQ